MRGLAETILHAANGAPVVRRGTVMATSSAVWPTATVQVGGAGGDHAEDVRVLDHVLPLFVGDQVLLEFKGDGWLVTGRLPELDTPGSLSIGPPTDLFHPTAIGWQNIKNFTVPGDPDAWWKFEATGSFNASHTGVEVTYGFGFGRVGVIVEPAGATCRISSAGRFVFATHELYGPSVHGSALHLASYRNVITGTQQILNLRITAVRVPGPPLII